MNDTYLGNCQDVLQHSNSLSGRIPESNPSTASTTSPYKLLPSIRPKSLKKRGEIPINHSKILIISLYISHIGIYVKGIREKICNQQHLHYYIIL